MSLKVMVMVVADLNVAGLWHALPPCERSTSASKQHAKPHPKVPASLADSHHRTAVFHKLPVVDQPCYWSEHPLLDTVAPEVHCLLPLLAPTWFSCDGLHTLLCDAKEAKESLCDVAE
jgi:hypothetical protein